MMTDLDIEAIKHTLHSGTLADVLDGHNIWGVLPSALKRISGESTPFFGQAMTANRPGSGSGDVAVVEAEAISGWAATGRVDDRDVEGGDPALRGSGEARHAEGGAGAGLGGRSEAQGFSENLGEPVAAPDLGAVPEIESVHPIGRTAEVLPVSANVERGSIRLKPSARQVPVDGQPEIRTVGAIVIAAVRALRRESDVDRIPGEDVDELPARRASTRRDRKFIEWLTVVVDDDAGAIAIGVPPAQ